MNILNITLVISPMGLFRWEKLKMRKHLKAQVCRQKSNINEGNKETSEKEWMLSFIENLITTFFFFYIKPLLHKCSYAKLLDWCKRRIQLGTEVAVKLTFHCPSYALLISFNIFKRFIFRTTTLRVYVTSLLCGIPALLKNSMCRSSSDLLSSVLWL